VTAVYLAYPVDNLSDTELLEVEEWRRKVEFEVVSLGCHVYSPGKAWTLSPEQVASADVQDVNWDAMRRCSLMVAYMPSWSRSIGVPIEIERFAREFGRTVLVQRAHISYALAGVGPTVHTFPAFDLLKSALRTKVLKVQSSGTPGQRHRARWYSDDPHAQPPRQGYSDDAGYDLICNSRSPIVIQPGATVDVPSGVSMQFPEGTWALLVGRSSSFRNRQLLVNSAIIDPGFRGELFAITHNFGTEVQVVEPGDRIAQVVPLPALAPAMLLVHGPLDPSERGTQGFGSTGR